MALLADYTARGGYVVPNAYVRVTDMHIAKVAGDFRLTFRVAAFVDQATAAQPHRTVDEPGAWHCPYDPEGANPYAQAYDWLKNGEGVGEGLFPAAVDA